MFRSDYPLSTEDIADQRLVAVFEAIAKLPRKPLRPIDFLTEAIHSGDQDVEESLNAGLRPGHSLVEIDRQADNASIRDQTESWAPPRPRESFTAEALGILDEFSKFLSDGTEAFQSILVELFLGITLSRLGEDSERVNTTIDLNQCRQRLIRRILKGVDFGPMMKKLFAAFGNIVVEPTVEQFGDDDANGSGAWTLSPAMFPYEDLTLRARQAEFATVSPFAGDSDYERIFAQIERALSRRQTPHVLLSGERGVGKATVATEFTRRLVLGDFPLLGDQQILLIDGRHIPADESRGRLIDLFNAIAPRDNLVVAFEGLAELLRATPDRANRALLLSALRHSRFRLIALVTPREAEQLISDDPDFGEMFARIEVHEPTADAALPLLRHYARSLQQRFDLEIDDAAVGEAATLTGQYIWNDQLPAKALKALYQVCEDIDFDRRRRRSTRNRVTVDDVVRVVGERTGVPEETLRGIAAKCDYAAALRAEVLGQDHAVREMATELGLIKAGMTEPGKPASVVMFLGQTGTGKTELAKALARIYSTSKRLKVYTLGNCVEPHSVSTLIGVPPGYVGHDRGGPLVNDLLADPYGVFLLDEADKAHPDVLQPYLNLFDEGWVEDQRGVRAYADKAIFVLTTNVGQRMIAELAEQGKSLEEIATRMKEALSQIRHPKSERPVFAPEFLARIKRIIVFNPLKQEAIEGIARKQVRELCQNWTTRRGKDLEIPEDLVRHIANEAHRLNEASKGKEGGRVVRKLLADRIEASLQRSIAERPDDYRQCQRVRVGLQNSSNETELATVVVDFADEPRQSTAAVSPLR